MVYYCHDCETNILEANQLETGEYECHACGGIFVEIVEQNEEEPEEMLIQDGIENEPEISSSQPNQPNPQSSSPQSEPRNNNRNSWHFQMVINGQVVQDQRGGNHQPQPPGFPQGFGMNIRNVGMQMNPMEEIFGGDAFVPNNFNPFGVPDRLNVQNVGGQANNGPPHNGPPHNFNPFGQQANNGPHPNNPFGSLFGGSNSRLAQAMMAMFQRREGPDPHPPAKKSAIDSLPIVEIDQKYLDKSETCECAVCQDKYKIGDKVSRLPCKHDYHKDCITPWLERHNTCPVCRHELESE